MVGPGVAVEDIAAASPRVEAQVLGHDGKWSVHPDQVPVLNEVFSPTVEHYARAWQVIDAYREAAEGAGRGAVTLGEEMIDEASHQAALAVVARGERAGMRRPQADPGQASSAGAADP